MLSTNAYVHEIQSGLVLGPKVGLRKVHLQIPSQRGPLTRTERGHHEECSGEFAQLCCLSPGPGSNALNVLKGPVSRDFY